MGEFMVDMDIQFLGVEEVKVRHTIKATTSTYAT